MIGPSQREAEIVFYDLHEQCFNAKKSRYIAPYDSNFYYAVCRFYYFVITSSYNAQFSLTIKDQTYLGAIFIALCTDENLLEGSYSIHR